MTNYRPIRGAESSLNGAEDDDFGEDIPLQEKEHRETDMVSSDDSDNRSETADEVEVEQQQSQPVPKWKQFNTYGSLIKSSCVAALPRFCQPQGLKVKGKLHPTAYLDALRGYAAFIVFVCHSFNSNDRTWRRQPFISVLFAGRGMVALFFVISGYVLSYSLLKNIRRQESAPTLEGLASSTFRRYLRLYGSTVLAIFITLIMVRLGWYTGGALGELYKPSLVDQIKDWLLDVIFFCNPFADMRGYWYNGLLDTRYLPTMWTIPVEFRGSIIVFSFCAATCKLSTRSRMILTWMIILVGYVWNALYVSEFLYGLFLADISLSRHPERLVRPGDLPRTREMSLGSQSKKQPIQVKICYSLLLLLGIFILGQPDQTDLGICGQFPWAFLKSFIPGYYSSEAGQYWYLSMGAFLLVLSLDSYPTLHRPLEWGVSQYIGELSFGIYALHPPLLWGGFYRRWAEPMRDKYLGQTYLAYIPGVLVMTFLVLVSADYFNRLDKKVVRFGKWLQRKTFRQWEN
jgi:peptidoglycan/LPS O-acetylase OafA/YrhL